MKSENKILDSIKKILELIVKFFVGQKVKTVAIVSVLLGLIYVVFNITTKTDKLSDVDKSKIDTITKLIEKDKEKINNVDSILVNLNNKLDSIDNKISEIENQKTIIREVYYEKVNNISEFNDDELYRFFTERYNFN
jgi:peptidoglycan hydrolase CwlO-like protein